MKLRNHPFYQDQTKPQISKHEVVHPSETTRSDVYVHPWYDLSKPKLNKPEPPSEEAIKKAQFVDKTYTWQKK